MLLEVLVIFQEPDKLEQELMSQIEASYLQAIKEMSDLVQTKQTYLSSLRLWDPRQPDSKSYAKHMAQKHLYINHIEQYLARIASCIAIYFAPCKTETGNRGQVPTVFKLWTQKWSGLYKADTLLAKQCDGSVGASKAPTQ